MNDPIQDYNKALVREAFETLFNRRDYAGAARYWSPDYVQHNPNFGPGREGLFDAVRALPPSARYEPGLIAAEGDLVMVHGRYSHIGLPADWIAVDIVRLENGVMVEHWDVIQDEATREQSKSGHPMFGDTFPQEKEQK